MLHLITFGMTEWNSFTQPNLILNFTQNKTINSVGGFSNGATPGGFVFDSEKHLFLAVLALALALVLTHPWDPQPPASIFI